MRDYKSIYEEWLNSDFIDEDTKNELRSIRDDDNEIKERFYMDLQFGTAGLRGIMGAGTNRMNKYIIMKTTQGLANYINDQNVSNPKVAIAFDSRINADKFASIAALTLAANGIKAYIFDSLRPTPMLSYAVRYFGCISGINITASHNPSEYNGYKVYWQDGAQISAPHDSGITKEVLKISSFDECKLISKEEAIAANLYEVISSKMDDDYMIEIQKLIRHKAEINKYASSIDVVYTPLNGAGNKPVRRILTELGFNVHVVKEQEAPDGNFPTIPYPNPETDEAFELGLKLAKEIDADVVLATDPDSDRIGIRVKDLKGEWHTLNGNMSGCLIAEYEVASQKELGILKKDSYLIKSIVSSNLIDAIADYYNIRVFNVLTGFKNIGRKMLEEETNKTGTYAFGYEESYGCLIGDYARDKDAVSASMAFCEAVAYYKSKGITLWEAMQNIYDKYGYYYEDTVSVTLKGIDGLERIDSIMNDLRNKTPKTLGDFDVLYIDDYKLDIRKDVVNDKQGSNNLPSSNVIRYILSDNSWCCVRPSGTEPKIKLYVGAKADSEDSAKKRALNLSDALSKLAGI